MFNQCREIIIHIKMKIFECKKIYTKIGSESPTGNFVKY